MFVIVMGRVPSGAFGAILTSIDRLVELPDTTVAVTPAPPIITELTPVRFVPVTFETKLAPGGPAAGIMAVIIGAGARTVNTRLADIPPPGPGVTIVIDRVAGAWIMPAGKTAVSVPELLKEVATGVPFTNTVELEVNPEPASVIVRLDDPALTELGVRLSSTGIGFVPGVDGAGNHPGGGRFVGLDPVPVLIPAVWPYKTKNGSTLLEWYA